MTKLKIMTVIQFLGLKTHAEPAGALTSYVPLEIRTVVNFLIVVEFIDFNARATTVKLEEIMIGE